MRTRLTVCLWFVAIAALAAQAPQGPSQPPTFRSGANYVRVDMYAFRDGDFVSDLRADEIEVLEDGVPQKIEDFEHVVVHPAGAQETRNEPAGLRDSREAAGDPRARVFVIFLDTYHTQAEGAKIMRQPLVRFLDRVLGADDLVALMTPEMAASDITLGRKTAIISNVLSEEWWGRRFGLAEDRKEVQYRQCAAEMGLNPDEQRKLVNEVIGRRRETMTFDAVEDLMTHLGGLRDERKAVVMVTEGWILYEPDSRLPGLAASKTGPAPPNVFQPPVRPPSDTGPFSDSSLRECETDFNSLAAINDQLRLRVITEDANRGNVTFYPIYARGLVSFDAPIGPDPPPPPLVDAANLRTRQENMRTMAVETDGEAVINTNNIEGRLKRIADDLSSYYLLGYYSTNTKLDGRFRSITVRVKRQGVKVRARRGYRARTVEQISATVTGAKVPSAVLSALNSVVALNSRSSFRVRSSVWSPRDAGDGARVWIVGELDFRTRREPAWTAGAQAEVILLAADGDSIGSTRVELPAGQGSLGMQVPITGRLVPGDYAVRVRLRAAGGAGEISDTSKVTIPERASPIGEPVLWRRGPSTGPQYVRTADPQFQRSDRVRLELPSSVGVGTARLLDRTGKPLQIPIQLTERVDSADGTRWIVADVVLAALAAGDYAIEVHAGDATQVTGFRIVP